VADSLSGDSSVFTSDDDPELVKEAMPFALKTFESLLTSTPEHEGLLLSAAQGFISYAYLLQQEADLIDDEDYKKAKHLRKRASKLFLRGRDFAFRGLNLKNENFKDKLIKNTDETLSKTEKSDIHFLYWSGIGWAGAIAAAKDDTRLIVALPYAAALIKHILEVDESYGEGAVYEFLIAYEAGRPNGNLNLCREYYKKAMEYSKGKRVSVYLSLAENVSVQEQNTEEFKNLIDSALAINVDDQMNIRLVNTISQKRAKWLKENITKLFL